jgi:hypothetical protein
VKKQGQPLAQPLAHCLLLAWSWWWGPEDSSFWVTNGCKAGSGVKKQGHPLAQPLAAAAAMSTTTSTPLLSAAEAERGR